MEADQVIYIVISLFIAGMMLKDMYNHGIR